MNHTKFLLLATTALAAAGVVLAGKLRTARQLRQAARTLLAASTDPVGQVYHERQLTGLPAPVQRYFRRVLREGQPYLRGVCVRHAGQFKTDLQRNWVSITGEEYLVAEPPGFIWQGTTRWFTARDEYTGGQGHFQVHVLGAVPLLHGAGPAYDQGELLRWLGECVWLPTALLPSGRVAWSAVDEHSARLTLTHGGQQVQYLVHFNAQDEIVQCETQRYQGETRLLPWRGRFSQYQERQGVRAPTHLEALWVIAGQEFPYARFIVQELRYAPLEPF